MYGQTQPHESSVDSEAPPVQPANIDMLRTEIRECANALQGIGHSVQDQHTILLRDAAQRIPEMSDVYEPFLINELCSEIRQLTSLAHSIAQVSRINNHFLFGIPNEGSVCSGSVTHGQ